MEIGIEIDGLTNCLVNRNTGEECDTQYRLISKTITKADAEKMMQNGWLFDWSVPHINNLGAKNIDAQNMYIDSYAALNLIKKYFSTEV